MAIAVALTLSGAGIAVASGAATTEVRTIQDRDGDNRLEPAPGDDYMVRDELGEPAAHGRGLPLLTFGQMTDFQLVDEESPARVEFLDKLGPPFTSAYRPQEGTGPQVVDQMVDELRNAVSPVTHEQIQLVMTTGDNTDNTQCNETRWAIDILDGAANGDAGTTATPNCVPASLRPTGRRVDPNSGVEGTCDVQEDGSLYDGVRGSGEYYEPDSSDPAPGADEEDGPGYSPDQSENEREAQRSSSVRDFPGLFERMNQPFLPVGFDDLPWYGIFGNHDGLVQGNQNRNALFDAIAQGCVKITGLPTAFMDRIRRGDTNALLQGIQTVLSNPSAFPGLTQPVPADPRRHLLFKREYMAQHFVTSGVPMGHGFTAEDLALGQGYYTFSPRPGVRFIVLDSVADAGGDRGNIDETQFQWLDRQLAAADTDGELTFVFAHHTLETMNQQQPSTFPPGDNPPPPYENVHFGEASPQQACPAGPPGPTETLKCLFLRHKTVVGYVVGHEHNNRIRPVPRSGINGDQASGRAAGGFWEIVTASHIDWPQQSRLLDLVDNGNGTLSIWGTMLDHAAPPNPGGAPPSDGQGSTGPTTQRLASISRELSFNDRTARTARTGDRTPAAARVTATSS